MKFSYNWLAEMVEALDASAFNVERGITIHTAECEGIESHGSDSIIEVDNKSLTHRPDLWGHYGMAREVAAILGKPLKDPVAARDFPGAAPVRVTIEDYALCPRYSALVFENVTVGPSPKWLADRLESVGINAINNIVDVTNYVLAEIAQPMHAFDADKLAGDEIVVRTARTGEKCEALNGETYDLDPSNLVIADAQGAIAIAGIIGGGPSSISASTKRIVLESANFNASSVRKTSSKIHLRTDALMRFEKAQDPVNTIRGLQRAYALLQEVSPGIRLVGGLADAHRLKADRQAIRLDLTWLSRKLGRVVPDAEVRLILEALGFRVEGDTSGFSVHVPSWRATKDVSIREDLVEEIGRMIGYDSIVPTAPLVPATPPPASPQREYHHRVRQMAAAQGFTEVYNYSFISEDLARTFALDPTAMVQVANPIAAEQDLMRTSLLPGICRNIRDNARHLDSFRLFEIGREVYPDREIPHIAAAMFSKDDGAASLFELKRLAECLAPGVTVRLSTETRSFEHPKRSADVMLGETRLGRLFEFHPSMVEGGRAAVLDLDLLVLEQVQPKAQRYRQLRRFPTSAFDLSIVAPARALIGDVQALLTAPEIVEVAFLREFALADGQRSLSFRVTVGSLDRTLSSEEIGAAREVLTAKLSGAGYNLR